MTSGAYGGAGPGPYDVTAGTRRSWAGDDGRYTTWAGNVTHKWNNYTCTHETWFRASLKLRMRYWKQATLPDNGRVNWFTYDNDLGFGFDAPVVWTSNDQLKLLQKLLEKVKSHDFNLAVNLGQLHQTVDLLSSNLLKLGRAAIALKRGQFATAARQLGARPRGTRLKTSDISGRWLELQYGWLPLLGDSFEAAKAFEAISNGPRSQTYRASSKKVSIGNGSQSKTIFDMPYTEELARHIQYECTEELGFARQLGLLDPLSVAWELLPWSFVVDWFIPIGSYLDLVNQIPSLKGRFLTTEVRKREAMGRNHFGIKAHFYELFSTGWDKPHFSAPTVVPMFRQKRVDMTRTYSESLSVPFPSMHLGGAVSGRRLWNAISLAQQRFGAPLLRTKPALFIGDLLRLKIV